MSWSDKGAHILTFFIIAFTCASITRWPAAVFYAIALPPQAVGTFSQFFAIVVDSFTSFSGPFATGTHAHPFKFISILYLFYPIGDPACRTSSFSRTPTLPSPAGGDSCPFATPFSKLYRIALAFAFSCVPVFSTCPICDSVHAIVSPARNSRSHAQTVITIQIYFHLVHPVIFLCPPVRV